MFSFRCSLVKQTCRQKRFRRLVTILCLNALRNACRDGEDDGDSVRPLTEVDDDAMESDPDAVSWREDDYVGSGGDGVLGSDGVRVSDCVYGSKSIGLVALLHCCGYDAPGSGEVLGGDYDVFPGYIHEECLFRGVLLDACESVRVDCLSAYPNGTDALLNSGGPVLCLNAQYLKEFHPIVRYYRAV